MLKAEFPQARLTAGDLNQDGVLFCERVFGAKPIFSAERAADVEIDDQFDLLWCGSLLTHLDLDRWHEFFELLVEAIEHQGLFVFTAFGDWAASRMRARAFTYRMTDDLIEQMLDEYERSGFAYSDYPGETLSGMSLTSPPWLFTQLGKTPELRLVGYWPRAWSEHQDVVACVRASGR
jgi:hypothetical protein